MKKLFAVTAALALLCLGSLAQAVVIDTVPVGDPGNAGELSGEGAGGYGPDRICGSVGYSYDIGKYEVTAGQYTDFLNAVAKTDTYGLYNNDMWGEFGCKIQRSGSVGSYAYSVVSDWANRPVNYVTYWDACRFANWLNNGQPTGLQNASTTEDGAYYLNGYNGTDGRTIQRNANWKWAVTSEDEWYKAAYYKGGGLDAGYWDYPTKSDSLPAHDVIDPDPGNNANICDLYGLAIGSPYYRTNAGEFENSESPYGTYDQAGNVWEWDEALVYSGVPQSGFPAYRGLRGGSLDLFTGHSVAGDVRAASRYCDSPVFERFDVGFRVSEVVPEPSSVLVLGSGILALAGMIRRKRNG